MWDAKDEEWQAGSAGKTPHPPCCDLRTPPRGGQAQKRSNFPGHTHLERLATDLFLSDSSIRSTSTSFHFSGLSMAGVTGFMDRLHAPHGKEPQNRRTTVSAVQPGQPAQKLAKPRDAWEHAASQAVRQRKGKETEHHHARPQHGARFTGAFPRAAANRKTVGSASKNNLGQATTTKGYIAWCEALAATHRLPRTTRCLNSRFPQTLVSFRRTDAPDPRRPHPNDGKFSLGENKSNGEGPLTSS